MAHTIIYALAGRKVLRLIADQVDSVHPLVFRLLGEVVRQEPLQSIQGPVRQRG
jgi:hypothetical protein